MARMLFGGEPSYIYLHEDPEGDLQPFGPLLARCYSGPDESAGAITDLMLADGETPVSTLYVSDGNDGSSVGQLPLFYGPDEVYELWVSVNQSPRQLLRPVNMGSVLAVTKELVDDLFDGSDPNPFNLALSHVLGVNTAEVEDAPEGTTLVKKADGTYGVGSSAVPLTNILWVAASNAPANFVGAPYVCDGVADEVQINEALNNSFGLRVGLSPGTFQLADYIRMRNDPSPTVADASPRSQYLMGCGQNVTNLVVNPALSAGIYVYDNVGAHIWDLTIQVNAQRGILAFRPSGSATNYASMVNGSIRRVTVAGPSDGSHAQWGVSLKSVDRCTVEELTLTNVRSGLEIVTEADEQVFGDIAVRRCQAVLVGNGGQAFRIGSDAGTMRGVTFSNCVASATATQTTTEGFRVSVVTGQTCGIRFINCVSKSMATALRIDAAAFGVDADFSYVEPRQSGVFAQVAGYDNRIQLSEFRVPTSVTAATLMVDTGIAALPNTYWHHVYTAGTASVTGTLGNGVVVRGMAEGSGTVSAALLRNRNLRIDSTNILPVKSTGSAVGTATSGWTTNSAIARTSLDGKLVSIRLDIKSTNGIVISGSTNIADTNIFTLNSAFRPTEAIYGVWHVASSTGMVTYYTDGVVTLATGNSTIAAGANLKMTITFIRD